MKSHQFLFAAVLTLTLLMTGVATQTVAAEQGESDLSPIARATFSSISQCLATPEAQLNVLYLLDASSSLEEDHDPQRLRGPILAQAISQLGAVADKRPVYFAVSSFDRDYQVRRDWQKLTAKNLNESAEWAKNQYSWWGKGLATNWLAALQGGQATMQKAPKPENDEAAACQVMIWFTDGGINVTRKSDFAANADAMTEICGRDPLTNAAVPGAAIVDSIRSSGIHLVGVLLQNQDYLNRISQTDRDDEASRLSFMRPITEGQGQINNAALVDGAGSTFEYECGRIPVPEKWATGALLFGNNPFSLAYAFSDLTAAIQGIQIAGEDIGPFPAPILIEPGINFMIVQLVGTDWTLTGPNGDTVAAKGDSPRGSGIEINQQGDLAGITIQGAALPPGQWTLDVKSSRSNLSPSARLYRDIKVDGEFEVSEFRAGEAGEVSVNFIDSISEAPVKQGVYDFSPLQVSVSQGGRPPQDLVCQLDSSSVVFRCSFTPDGPGTVIFEAAATLTSGTGQFQTNYSGSFTKSVLPAPGFPAVSPDIVQLSDLDGRRGMATGKITLIGPSEGSGGVCFPEAKAFRVVSDVVDRINGYRVTGETWGKGCVSLQQGESRTIDIAVANETAASGSVEIAFDVELRSDSSARIETQQVTLTFDTIRQGSPPPWLLIALFLTGFLVPIALLYGQARAASKLSLGGLQTAVIPVKLDIASGRVSISRQQPRDSQLFQLDDWQWLTLSSKRPRTFTSAEGVVLKARIPKSPVGPLTAEAIAPAGSRIITSEQGYGSVDGHVGRFGLMPANQWFIVARDSDLGAAGTSVLATLVGYANPAGGSLPEVSREMSISAQDMSLIGSWETIRQQVSGDREADGVSESPDNEPSSQSTNVFRDMDSNKTSELPPTTTPGPVSPPSPFDEITGSRNDQSGDPSDLPSPLPPRDIDDPFKDL